MIDKASDDAQDVVQTPVANKTVPPNGSPEPATAEPDPPLQPSFGIIDEGTIWPHFELRWSEIKSRLFPKQS